MTALPRPSNPMAPPNERLAHSVKCGDSEAASLALGDGACPWIKRDSECMAMLAIRLGHADVLDVVMAARASRGKPILAKFVSFAKSMAWSLTYRYRVFSHLKKNGLTGLTRLPADPETTTPLMVAAWRGDAASCSALIRQASIADFLSVDSNMDSALHLALGAGSAQCARMLIPHCDLNKANLNGITPLMSAASNVNEGMGAIVAMLMPRSDLRARSPNGFTAIHWAISNQNNAALEALAPAFPPELYDDENVNVFLLCMDEGNLRAISILAARAPDHALSKALDAARSGGHAQMEAALNRVILSREELAVLSATTASCAPSAKIARRL